MTTKIMVLNPNLDQQQELERFQWKQVDAIKTKERNYHIYEWTPQKNSDTMYIPRALNYNFY